MDSASLRDFRGGGRRLRGRRVGKVSTTPCQYGRAGGSEEAGSLPQHQKVPGNGKAPNTYGFDDACFSVPYSSRACFNWQAVQATYRLEEATNDQSKALEQERDKCLDATRTLKNSEADLLKVREDLKEITRARDSTESGLASA